MKKDNAMLNQVLKYYTRYGWSVIPVGKDKKPLIPWKRYQNEKANEAQIHEWWTKWSDANIGIVTGEISGICVIDIDPKNGGSNELFQNIKTPTVKTGGNGYHYYCLYRKGLLNKAGIQPGIDIRSDGGYVVASPSLHESGQIYEWIVSPEVVAFAPLPDFVVQWIQSSKSSDKHVNNRQKNDIFSGVKEGTRNEGAASIAGSLLSRYPQDEWESKAWPLTRAWNTQNTSPLSENELRAVFNSISLREKERKEHEDSSSVTNGNALDKSKRIITAPSIEKVITFDQWANIIKANFPSLFFAAEVSMSILAQLLILDITNPFGLVLVDRPSAGKTIAINFFDDIEDITYSTDKFSPASFVSNSANVSKSKLKEIDLLPRIRYKMLLVRDFATIFSKREEDLKDLLGTLTRVFDGEGLSTDSGTHGQRKYTGEYLFMMLAATTPIPPRVWKIMGSLGARLFFINLNSVDKSEEELAQQLTDLSYKEKETIARQITKQFVFSLWNQYPEGIKWDKTKDEKKYRLIISRCASLLAKLRGVVQIWKDGQNDTEFQYQIPVIERADRINQLFYNLVRGHALIAGRDYINNDDLRLIVELAIDSAPTTRSKLLRTIIRRNGSMKTNEVEKLLDCSKPTAIKEMKTLEFLGLCKNDDLVGESEFTIKLNDKFTWFISDECKAIQKPSTPSDLLNQYKQDE